MNSLAARGLVVLLSFVVLGIASASAALSFALLDTLGLLPRTTLSLLVFVSAYYLGANLIFWTTVVRISPPSQPGKPA